MEFIKKMKKREFIEMGLKALASLLVAFMAVILFEGMIYSIQLNALYRSATSITTKSDSTYVYLVPRAEDEYYMVFCHEWIQVKDGEICAIQLSDDLTRAVGEPFVLFRASETPNVSEVGKGSGYYITDGPFLYNENGKLNLMWSSFYKGKYQVLLAQSDSLKGKWEHKGCQFDFDGGHAMLFKTLDGVRMISLHSPNVIGDERAFFCEY